jgi:lysophospholipase L1-like esterase
MTLQHLSSRPDLLAQPVQLAQPRPARGARAWRLSLLALCVAACGLAACEESTSESAAADTYSGADLGDAANDTDPTATSSDATSPDATTSDATSPDATTSADGVEDMADGVIDPSCPGDALAPAAVRGVVYTDGDSSSSTLYSQRIQPPIDGPMPGVVVHLLGPGGEAQQAMTCSTGAFAFDSLGDGRYLLRVEDQPGRVSTSTNHARRLHDAAASGHVKVLAFGDSLPAYGPQPWFSERFSDGLRQLTVEGGAALEVVEVNVAEPGSETSEWLPGSPYFQQRLVPQLADADVIVFSLGGNDLSNFVGSGGGAISAADLADKVDQLDPFLAQIEDNLTTIYEELRVRAPNADIVWILYPNYARSAEWQALAGEYAALAEFVLRTKLSDVRQHMGDTPGLLIMDIFNATAGVDLNPLLIDPLHLSQAGHQLFADELFLTLGGVRVEGGEVAVMPERLFGFSAP